jgi:Tol biopolymer transport system component
MDSDGTALTQLTHNTANDRVPKWSPDGGRIVFRSERDGHSEIYVMDGDGSNQRRLTQFVGSQQYRPHWSPDGTRVSFLSSDTVAGGVAELYVVNSDGTEQVLVGPAYGGFLSHNPWSPDGRRLAYMKMGPGF